MVKGVSIMRKLAFSGLIICQGNTFLFKLLKSTGDSDYYTAISRL